MAEATPFDPIDVELRDGRCVRVREIRPDDRDELRQAFDRLSSHSRYTRFMSSVRTLSPQMLERAVRPRDEGGRALVAEIDAADGIDIVGGARYYVEADGKSCEFAVTVGDAWQGAGLAARLMRELIGVARARGLARMEGFVLSDNRRMLALARRLGFTARLDPGDATVTIVSLDLTPHTERA